MLANYNSSSDNSAFKSLLVHYDWSSADSAYKSLLINYDHSSAGNAFKSLLIIWNVVLFSKVLGLWVDCCTTIVGPLFL